MWKMADQTVASKKRKQKSTELQPTKLRRSERIQNKIENNPLRVLLTDLNIDCLEHICQYLELPDLFMVAQTSEQLQKAAQYIF